MDFARLNQAHHCQTISSRSWDQGYHAFTFEFEFAAVVSRLYLLWLNGNIAQRGPLLFVTVVVYFVVRSLRKCLVRVIYSPTLATHSINLSVNQLSIDIHYLAWIPPYSMSNVLDCKFPISVILWEIHSHTVGNRAPKFNQRQHWLENISSTSLIFHSACFCNLVIILAT